VFSKGVPLSALGEFLVVRNNYRIPIVGVDRNVVVLGLAIEALCRFPTFVAGVPQDLPDTSVDVIVEHESQDGGLRWNRASTFSSSSEILP
jgi:hypothetical protein